MVPYAWMSTMNKKTAQIPWGTMIPPKKKMKFESPDWEEEKKIMTLQDKHDYFYRSYSK